MITRFKGVSMKYCCKQVEKLHCGGLALNVSIKSVIYNQNTELRS